MRLKLDENLPLGLIDDLAALGHDVEHVYQEQLSGKPDPDVWAAAQREHRLLITQDVRFADARILRPGSTSGLMLVRLKKPGLHALRNEYNVPLPTSRVRMAGLVVSIVLTDTRLRVRRPV